MIRVFTGIDARGEEEVSQTTMLTGLTPEQVRTAAQYYADFPLEIDDWIRRVDEETARAEAGWQHRQDFLRA